MTNASVVIPAHNEERSIGRLLSALLRDAPEGELDVVVVCNGCTDATAAVARSFGPAVRVEEITTASKMAALTHGDMVTRTFPRMYVDADVVIGTGDIRALAYALGSTGALAVAPRRQLDRFGAHPLVRSYYDVWERLPQVDDGLFGRGVIAVSREGHERISALPHMMSDDLAFAEAFGADERHVVSDATVVVSVPRTVPDLLRRRVRVATGNVQMDDAGMRSKESRTSVAWLLRLAVSDWRMCTRLPVFLIIAVVARAGARRRIRTGDDDNWLRDESSRAL